ncbi:MAG: serine/threonine-protein kinase, partial [Myxococcota bacterium]
MTGSHPSGLPQPDEIVGQYRIVGEIGRGGMAAVLEALRLHDGARCALKVMLPATRSEDVAERFRREFRALSHLSHPNVLKVYEGGVYDGRPFFAMELLDGRELRDEVEQWRGLPPGRRFERARDILIQLARALEYIHNRGWVHRDVTPANIMILPDGQVKLMDFGVVKEPGADLTVAGEVVGTVAYIAPEQIRGQRVDARADLYSLGAVLYLMLTGRRPFNARTLSGYLDKHLNRTVRPPHALAPTVSRELDAICVRLLEKDPAARFASATHLLYMLGAERPALQAAAVTTIAGRAWERSVLREAVALLDAGRGGLIMLEGASGMGCSRLVSEGVRLSRQLGIAISWGQNRSPNQPAFSGLREIYTNLLAEGRDSPAALTLTYDGGEERAELYAICAAFKELMASEAPRLVCIEDIDRADPGTLQVVEYLIRNLAELPVLFLLSRRPPEDPAHDPLSGLISGESTEVQARHLILEPLPV